MKEDGWVSTLRSSQINNAEAIAVVLEDASGFPVGDQSSLLSAILEELRLIRLTLADIGDNNGPDYITDEVGE